jgi:flavin-dependent dehydrogenase
VQLVKAIDLAIVGGGPAGLSLALTLIQRDPGWRQRMVVLEKAHHPRHKLCGGGLTVLALNEIKRLGLILDIHYVRLEQARFSYRDLIIDLPGDPAFVVTRRSEFDHWLALQAKQRHVPLLEGVEVKSIERASDRLHLTTNSETYAARMVVGADGSRGVVRSWLVGRENPPHVARLLEFVQPTDADTNPYFLNQYAQFDFSALEQNLQGYFWDFPSKLKGVPHMNLGLFDSRIHQGRPRAKLPDILHNQATQRQVDPEQIKLEGHPIHWFAPSNQLNAERVLLVGDAAGAEPLFGEGIGIALAYSQLAADEIEDAFKRSAFHFPGYRRRLLMSPLGRYLLLRWLVAAILYRFGGRPLIMKVIWAFAAGVAWLAGSLPPVEGVLAEDLPPGNP